MQFRPDVGNGPGLALRRPGPGPPFPAPPLRGGFPVDYGPRVDDRRYAVQVPVRNSTPKQQADDQEESQPSRHLWVGNVSHEVTEGLLVEKFSKFGPIESVTVYSQRNYAFINFKNLENAQDAKAALQGVTLGGLAMRIEFAKGAKPSRHLWVGGVAQTVSREQLEGEFKRFGNLEDFKFLRDRNCAFVDYVKIEDAIAAVDALNRKRFGDEELRVDFGRSQPPKRETPQRPGTATQASSGEERVGTPREFWSHSEQFRGPQDNTRGPSDSYRDSVESTRGPQSFADGFRGPSDAYQAGSASGAGSGGAGSTAGTSGRNRDKEEPSDVLWVGFPLLSKVDEDGLRRAFIPYGEVERVKTFPGRTYAFVQFRSIEEASRAKDALEGKLFNDPRVHIRFSNSEIGPVDNPRSESNLVSPSGREGTGMGSRIPAGFDRFSSTNPPMRPTGLRPEYYPGGLSRGATMARGSIPGSGINLGRGGGRGLGSSEGRLALDERDFQNGVQGAGRAGHGLGARPGGRPPYDEWGDLPEEDGLSREPKRIRMGGILSSSGSESVYDSGFEGRRLGAPERSGFGSGIETGNGGYGLTGSGNPSGGDDYSHSGPRSRIGPLQFDAPRPLAMGQSFSGPASGPGPTVGFSGAGKRESFGSEGGVTGINEGWRWHGTIAKGGTPVCRARCLPVGKGIDVTVCMTEFSHHPRNSDRNSGRRLYLM